MADNKTQLCVRALQRVWVPEHGCWIFVWCHDDGNLIRNHRIAYAVVSSPAEFVPNMGQFVLTCGSSDPGDTHAFKYCYGVPYLIESVNGSIKLYYTDFTPALAQPVDENDSGTGKDPKAFGYCLEGQWSREDLKNGPLLWTRKGQNIHNNPSQVIEVTDVQDVDAHNNAFGGPCGTLLVQYNRDSTGRIQVNDDGVPKIAKIDEDPNQPENLKNYKIGYLALDFVENYFGDGLHGWLGRLSNHFPWEITIGSGDESNEVHVRIGSVNSLIPSNAFDGSDTTGFPFAAEGSWYVKIRCDSDGKNVNNITLMVDQDPITINSAGLQATQNSVPPTFYDLLGIVIVENGKNYIHQIRNTNLTATASVVFVESRNDGLDPGQEPFIRWFRWSITSS